jgi:hypothetical protein
MKLDWESAFHVKLAIMGILLLTVYYFLPSCRFEWIVIRCLIGIAGVSFTIVSVFWFIWVILSSIIKDE